MRTELATITRRARALASRVTSKTDRALIDGITKAAREASAKFDLLVLTMPGQFTVVGGDHNGAKPARAGKPRRKAKAKAKARRAAAPVPEAYAASHESAPQAATA